MVSLTTIQRSIYAICDMAKANSVTLEFHRHRVIYKITIEPTYRRYDIPRRWHGRQARPAAVLPITDCQVCGFATVADICINQKCDTNTQPKAK